MERKTIKSRKSSTSSDEQTVEVSTRQETSRSEKQKDANITVRLQNADMLTKYRNKNPHIKIENTKTTSHCLASEISDDDEIWICKIPSGINATELVGRSIKLGSKKSVINTPTAQIDCVSSKLDSNGVYQNTMSVVFQDQDSRLSIKNIQSAGRLTFSKKIDDTEVPFELNPTGRHAVTIFPEHLVVRHPLLGRHFKEQVQVSDSIKRKLNEAKLPVVNREDTEESSQKTKKAKKRKAEASHESTPLKKIKEEFDSVEIKTESGQDEDLARIRQIFGQNT